MNETAFATIPQEPLDTQRRLVDPTVIQPPSCTSGGICIVP